MSTGDRLPLIDALLAAECIAGMWGLDREACPLVGSARRRAITVGDLEFIAPLPAPGVRDELFDRMDLTMGTGGLFGEGTVPVAKPLKGFKRGFGYCDTLVDVTNQATGQGFAIRVQIHRYAADGSNRGWIELMRTGPAEFGQFFLRAWKARHCIAPELEASIDGHLVNAARQRVPTPTEADAFRCCGLEPVEPTRRDAFAARAKEQWRHQRTWSVR